MNATRCIGGQNKIYINNNKDNGRLSVIPPLSLRKWQGENREEDGTVGTDGQMFLKLIRARICVYIWEMNCPFVLFS